MVEVSVIVPVYNASAYLEKCISSILGQTFENFELILINDGSVDNSGEICDEFAARDNRIRVIHQKNMGVSVARNQGLNNARGTYIMFCDADDWVREAWIAGLIGAIKEFPMAWIICGIEYIQNGTHTIIEPFNCKNDVVRREISDYYLIYENRLDGYCFNKIYRMDIIQSNMIRFDPAVAFGEDIDFNLKYLKCVEYIVGLPQSPYCYNADNLESATRRFDANKFEKHRYVYNLRKPFIEKSYIKPYAIDYYNVFMWDIKCLFDRKGVWKLRKKVEYSNFVLRTPEFRECVKMGASDGMNRLYVLALNTGCYLLVMLFDCVRTVRNRLLGKEGLK